MKGTLALAVLRELVQELLKEEGGFARTKAVRVWTQDLDGGRIRCEVRIEAADITIVAGVKAPPQASRRRLRIEMLKAMNEAIDRARGEG